MAGPGNYTSTLKFIFTGESRGLKTAANAGEKSFKRLARAQSTAETKFKRGKITGQEYIKVQNRVTESVKQETRALGALGIKVQGLNKVFKQGGAGRSRHGAHAAQEFTRGIADFNAAGGFTDFSRGAQGAANNVERMTEILGYAVLETGSWKGALKGLAAGFLGPVGVITAITLLVQFGPKIYEFFKTMFDGSTEAAEGLEKVNEKLKEQAGLAPGGQALQNEALAGISEALDDLAEIERIEQKQIRNGKTLQSVYVAQRKSLRGAVDDALKYLAAIDNNAYEKAEADRIAKERQDYLDYLRDLEDISEFEVAPPGVDDEPDTLEKAFPNFNRNPVKIVDANDVAVIDDYADSVEDLNKILRETNSIFAEMTVEQASAWMKATENFEKTKTTVKDLSGALIGAFESAAVRGGNVAENLAAGILSAIGSLLIKEGTAYITLGAARNLAFPGSGTEVTSGGIALVAAGIGLKAAGASVGSGGTKNTASSSGSSSSSVSPTPKSVQGAGDGGGFIGKVRGNELVLALQVGTDRRNQQTGSSFRFG